MTKHVGKGSRMQDLSGNAKSSLHDGDPGDRDMNQYAKATPMPQQTGGNSMAAGGTDPFDQQDGIMGTGTFDGTAQ
jgi:hypothetical protein